MTMTKINRCHLIENLNKLLASQRKVLPPIPILPSIMESYLVIAALRMMERHLIRKANLIRQTGSMEIKSVSRPGLMKSENKQNFPLPKRSMPPRKSSTISAINASSI